MLGFARLDTETVMGMARPHFGRIVAGMAEDNVACVGYVVFYGARYVPFLTVAEVSNLTWYVMTAYTMFNVFLPKMLEMSPGGAVPDGTDGNTLEGTMWDVVIFTIGGLPRSYRTSRFFTPPSFFF